MKPEDELQMTRNLLIEAARNMDNDVPLFDAIEDYFGTLYLIVAMEAGCEVADACSFAPHPREPSRDE